MQVPDMHIQQRALKVVAITSLAFGLGACSTWDGMSSRQQGAVGGAAVGGVAGSVISDGSILGTVGGAAIGGAVGDQVGK